MQKGKVRNMFPGANTSKGFFSFYNYIIDQEEAKRFFILKGGPGVGKSTFMKNISEAMAERGYDTEQMHCSSDSDSLDGVVIPKIGVAIIDGTAPHTNDPKYPGVTGEIINLGDCWDEDALRANKDKVVNIMHEIGSLFSRAYRYLESAAHIYEDTSVMLGSSINGAGVNKMIREISDELFGGILLSEMTGRQRCMFASAITPCGLKNYLDELMASGNVYVLNGLPGSGAEKLLEKIKSEALARGFFVEAYYCAFLPDKIEHLLIPDLNISFTTVNEYHGTDACVLKRIDFSEFLIEKRIGQYRTEIDYNKTLFDILLNKAIDVMHSAKILHDELETCYVPYMDFSAVQRKREEIMERMLRYAGEMQGYKFCID